MKKFVAHSLLETENFAKQISNSLCAGQTILLYGDMGSGKTAFTKFLLKALGVKSAVTSPTFAIVNVYESKFLIQHFDMYRLESEAEAIEAGIDEMLSNKNALNIVEWPDNVKNLLPKKNVKITIVPKGENQREFFVEASDERFKF